MKKFVTPIAAALLLVAPVMSAWADDRAPTEEERTKIEEALRAEGFTRWEEIELDDDGHWEVDDAVSSDGREYDLKLDANYTIVERDD